ncbi:ABC transporter permease [Paratractidigestivibacter sp.]|uniref:ABC transporter permease n=1 Tax=Paratractidigestivibacter sp. TaxID=2847316 RepID=UPI0040277DAA
MRSPDAWAGAVDGIAAEGSRQPPILHAAEVSLSGNRRRTVARLVAACALLLLVVVCGGVLRPQATATDFAQKNLAPCLAHLFGTDWMGRDMLARTVTGLSTSVWVGLAASVCSGAIALVLALVSALGGQAADAAVGWLIDLVMGVPHMVLLILVSYGLGRGFWGVTLAVALTHWGSLARVLRAEAIQIRDQPYLRLAQAAGASRSRIAFAHVMPAVLPQLIVGLVVAFPHAILHEASITFLGFGLGADEPAIGVILSEAMQYLSMGYWWLAVLPGLALVAVVLVFDRLGSSLRDLVAPDSTQA